MRSFTITRPSLRKVLFLLFFLWPLSRFDFAMVNLVIPSARAATPNDFDCNNVTGIPHAECQVLVSLYNNANGPNWSQDDNWLVTNTPCSWYGVMCADGHVISLQLVSNQLSGNIPAELSNLTKLVFLNFGSNRLSGSIPPELGNLTNLRLFEFNSNQLSGSIPAELGNLTKLQYLNLPDNQLGGSIPPELGNLVNLHWLQIQTNQLSGSLPKELGNLANLQFLYLFNNQLSGSIPPELGNLANLNSLSLGSNQLSGNIPPRLGNLANLHQLYLFNNQLSGSIPPELSKLSNLEDFQLSRNPLSGSIPLELVNLQALNVFAFADTNLCEPTDEIFQTWLTTIDEVYSTDISCNPKASKTAVVLIHGWTGLGVGMFSGIGCTNAHRTRRETQEELDDYFGPLDELIEQDREIFFARLVSNRCYTPPLHENVPYLMEAIAEAKDATGYSKVILVAHSMGGVVSRAYVEGSQYRGDVEALFTIGSPHHGVPHDLLTFTANGLSVLGDLASDWGTFCENRQPGMCDLSLTGMQLFNQAHILEPGIKYYFLSGDAPIHTRNPIGIASDALFLLQPNDGLVGLDSGIGASLTDDPNIWINSYVNDENHNLFGIGALYDWPYFGPRRNLLTSSDSKSYTKCLKPILVGGTQSTCTSEVSAVQAMDDLATFSRMPRQDGTLSPGRTVTHTFEVDGGPAVFVVEWYTGTMTMSLISPDNQIIDPAYALSYSSIISYTTSSNGAAYSLSQADGGSWRIVLEGENLPQIGTEYSLFASFATDLTLAGAMDRDWYVPGTTATLTATLGGLPTSALMTATVFAGNTPTVIALEPSGNGLYAGVYSVPAAPGYATVQLQATGLTPDNLIFERESHFAFQIAPNSATLTHTYDEYTQPNSFFPTLYQALTITVGINAQINRTLGLSADLVDSNGDFVAHSSTIQDIVVGATTLSLRFDRDSIFASQRNGPYTLTNLLLSDQTSTTLAVVEAKDVYTTEDYLYRSFASSTHVYIPFIQR